MRAETNIRFVWVFVRILVLELDLFASNLCGMYTVELPYLDYFGIK